MDQYAESSLNTFFNNSSVSSEEISLESYSISILVDYSSEPVNNTPFSSFCVPEDPASSEELNYLNIINYNLYYYNSYNHLENIENNLYYYSSDYDADDEYDEDENETYYIYDESESDDDFVLNESIEINDISPFISPLGSDDSDDSGYYSIPKLINMDDINSS